MESCEVLNKRLQRLAEHVRFREYVVCPTCFEPIILSKQELDALPVHLICPECGKRAWFEKAGVREYTSGT